MQTTLPTVRLSKREAKAALTQIDDLQPEAPQDLDWQECVLISLRGRLRDKRREVPSELWPELMGWLDEAPGLLKSAWPRRYIAGDEVIELVQMLMAWHVWAMFTPGIDPLWVLVSEGLLNALMVEPQSIVGDELMSFVRMVREDRYPVIRSAAA